MPTHTVERLYVTDDEVGNPISLAVHRIAGSGNGPTLGIFGTQHGDEWFAVPLLAEMLAIVRQLDFVGQVILVPVANPTALAARQRVSQADSDAPDLNRSWPGTSTWLSGQLATALCAGPLTECDAVIDLHTGCWGVAWGATQYGLDVESEDVRCRSRALAFGFGLECVQGGRVLGQFPGPASLTGYTAAALGRPAASVWLGGPGFEAETESSFRHQATVGMRNLLSLLGMLSEDLRLPGQTLHFTRDIRLNPLRGGLLRPVRDAETLRRPVEHGELLASVINPQTLDIVEEIIAPEPGALLYMSRLRPVAPGDWGFGLASADTSERLDPAALIRGFN